MTIRLAGVVETQHEPSDSTVISEREWQTLDDSPSAPDPDSAKTPRLLGRAEANDLLRTSDRLLNAVEQAVVAWDLGGAITYVNDAAEAIYGWPREAALGAQALEMQAPEMSAEQLAVINESLDAGRSWSGEMTIGTAAGSVLPMWVTHTPVIEAGSVVGFIGLAMDISERKAAEALTWHRATHDTLTDLPNHRSLTDQLNEQLRRLESPDGVDVILVDIGNIDPFRDRHGHAVGEDLIAWSARTVASAIHPGDLLARFSDTTFAIGCSHAGSVEGTFEFASNLCSKLQLMVQDEHPGTNLRTSAGFATMLARSEAAEEVLQQAAIALTQAKRDRSVKQYDPSMRAAVDDRHVLQGLVADAVLNGRVGVGYQPVVNLEDQHIVGAETLLRMTDHDGEPLSAYAVVQAAEVGGLMADLGNLVLRQACLDASTWNGSHSSDPISVAVNVSATQLDDPLFVSRVAETLSETGIAPSLLWLEITEGTLMRDPGACCEVLVALKELGVNLSADDFGTGYSSLAYLKRFPLDILKIDQSFVAGLPGAQDDTAIAEAIVALSEALDLIVVAEGIEEPRQLQALKEMGVRYG